MTRVLSVNANNDIFAVNGRIQVSTGLAAVLINCEAAMRAQRGEMIYAADRGVNYFENVWSGSPNVIRFEAESRAQLSRVPGVVSISAFSAVVRNNILFYTVTINTEFGTETINGEL